MLGRRIHAGWIGLVLIAFCSSRPAPAQQPIYNYGAAGDYSGKSGFVFFFEGILTNPRNTDNVIVTEIGGTVRPIIPTWDDDLAGRLGFGYQWSNGNKLVGRVWGYSTETTGSGTGTVAFAIGPPISSGVGDIGTGYSITTEITARSADLVFGRVHPLGENFTLEWGVGGRYAYYEELASGMYVNGGTLLGAAKSNEGSMLGGEALVRASYRFAKGFSIDSGLGFSFLSGELTATSGLEQVSGPPSSAKLTDDSRSGNIIDFDIAFVWHSKTDGFRLVFGWEQLVWDGIATDLMRNLPGTVAPLRERDSVTFSGLKLGFHFLF